MPSSIAVILNATAGADDKKDVAEKLAEHFQAGGLDARVTLARSGTEITEAARQAVNEKAKIIVAGGGDGTINGVASVVVGTDITLGVLPLGTLNHFAKDLGIPLEVEDAVRNIIAGHVVEVDVGEVNDRIFINNSSLGLYPQIVRHREEQQERLGRGKWPAFVWAALTVLRRYPFLSVRLNADGEDFARRTPFVFIGNNEYQMESFNIGARECLNAGHLSLYVAHRTGRLGLLRLAFSAFFGRLRQAKDFDAVCAKEIWIETRHRRLRVATDGEVTVMDTPLHYLVKAGALRVIVPEKAESNGT
ncbi:MAG: diacylglycerol kinase family protein [Pyrinomonadaceae bacterium]